MDGFELSLTDINQTRNFDAVRSFVGEDASGSFGILPGHARFMTAIVMGLCRFQQSDGGWLYAATAGGLLYFLGDRLRITTRHFFVERDYARISRILEEQLLAEEARLHSQKQSLRRMEEEVLKRLWELGHAGVRVYDET